MSETIWFRRGDGAEFCVPVGSEAYHNLVAAGAVRVDALSGGGSAAEPEGPSYQQLQHRAGELGLSKKGTKAQLSAAIAAAEAEGGTEET